MGSLRLELAKPEHVTRLAPLMREADRLEVLASAGQTPEEALRESLQASAEAYALVEKASGEVLALFGVAPAALLAEDRGVVWLLTGSGVERHRVEFARMAREVVAGLSAAWPVLANFVDARYTGALRWLRALGFSVLPAVPYGAARLPFHPIILCSTPSHV